MACLCRFVTRLDVKKKHLAHFLDWSLTTVMAANDCLMSDVVVMDGTLQSLVTTLASVCVR